MVRKINIIAAFLCVAFSMPAHATYVPFNTNANMNIGIGTSSPGSNLSVLGSESLGAYATNAAPTGGLIVSGNVGIGSANPGQLLDVQGTVRDIGEVIGAGGLTLGGVTNTAWSSVGTNYWNYSSSGNIGLSTTAAVGIGTTFVGGTGEAALSVMNGNVGIGTWMPAGKLIVQGGYVGIGTTIPSGIFDVEGGTSTSGAGAGINLNAQNALSGTSNLGGSVNINAGNSTAITSGGNIGGSVNITGGQGAYVSGRGFGQGGGVNITGGVGASTDNGGQVYILGGPSGVSAGSGGSVQILGGVTTTEGAGGLVALYASNAATASGKNWAGGDISLTAGQATGTAQGGIVTIFGGEGSGSTPYSGGPVEIEGGYDNLGGYSPIQLQQLGGNVGIGSLTPGQVLDVIGTVRATGFTMTGQTPISGYVLTASDSAGDATWSSSSSVGTNYWNYSSSGNIGLSTTAAVGIGTTFVGGTGEAALSVMNGNVGIGTWVPAYVLDVQGSVRATGFNVSTSTATEFFYADANGNLAQTAGLSFDGTNMTIGSEEAVINTAGGWTAIKGGNTFPSGDENGGNIFEVGGIPNGSGSPGNIYLAMSPSLTARGGVTIGNTLPPVSLLDVENNISVGAAYAGYYAAPSNGMIIQGNVGIGTWVPGKTLYVNGSAATVNNTLDDGSGNMIINAGSNSSGSNLSFGNGQSANIYVPQITSQTNGSSLSIHAGAGSSCFAANTKIIMSDGSTKNIQDIKVGEFVKSYDVKDRQVKNSRVSKVFHHSSRDVSGGYLVLTMQHGQVLKVTPNHPIYINGQWKEAGTLALGDLLLNIDGSKEKLVSIQIIKAQIPVYNLEVDKFHTYFAQGLLVHNKLISQHDAGGNLYIDGGAAGFGGNPGNIILAYNNNGSVGIGTNEPNYPLDVLGAIGDSTDGVLYLQNSGGSVQTLDNVLDNGSGEATFVGNVGIGSLHPGQELDVTGTVRATAFIGSGAGLTNVTGSNYWNYTASGNIGVSTIQAVGIGTTFVGGTGEAALSVMKGNVGIGTWLPSQAVSINGGINTLGNTSNSYLNSTGGNVGIGSVNPGQALDVNGRVRSVGIGTTVPEPTCIKADGTIGYYNTPTWQGTCN